MTRKAVDIMVLDGNTIAWKTIGSVLLSESGIIQFEGLSEAFIRELRDFGAVANGREGPIFPASGEKFLQALRSDLNRSSFVRASEMYEAE